MTIRQAIIRFLHEGKKVVLTPERLFYTRRTIPRLVRQMRQKEQIQVLFVVFELASWKTEGLYNRMREHPRFLPELLAVPSKENQEEIHNVVRYLEQKGYAFCCLKEGETIAARFHPDIIFYQKPYSWCIDKSLFFRRNLKSLFCYMSYCFRNTTRDFNQNTFFHNYAWQVYVENETEQEEMKAIMDNGGRNTIVTGLTVMDDLMKDKSCYRDPWKPLPSRKRIIYAPHHTIGHEMVHRSTFLQFGDFMLEMARKYHDRTQWVFKPHPLLRPKLEKMWGSERTAAYYEAWSNLENGQCENGEYMGLFQYSDAMIHDSGSFMLEYLYTHKPVMYLASGEVLGPDANLQTRQALEMHELGRTGEEIEAFIRRVIAGEDPKAEAREAYFRSHLIPPGGCSACENVIRAILGES